MLIVQVIQLYFVILHIAYLGCQEVEELVYSLMQPYPLRIHVTVCIMSTKTLLSQ